MRAGPKSLSEIWSFNIRERCSSDPASVIKQFLFELAGALGLVERNEIRDLGEVNLRPA